MTGAFFATSTDGLTWTVLKDNNPVSQPVGIGEGRVRDPYLLFRPYDPNIPSCVHDRLEHRNIGYSSIVPANGKSFTDQNKLVAAGAAVGRGQRCGHGLLLGDTEIFYDDIQNKYMIYLSHRRRGQRQTELLFFDKRFVNYTKGKSPEYGTPKFFDPGSRKSTGTCSRSGTKTITTSSRTNGTAIKGFIMCRDRRRKGPGVRRQALF